MEFHEIMSQLRDKLKTTTRTHFCKRYGINYNTFTSTLSGRKTMSQKEAKAIARFLGIDKKLVLKHAHDGKPKKLYFGSNNV